MTLNTAPDGRELALAPLDEKVDHVRGSPAGHLIIEYRDYECPYSRQAVHAIERVEQQLGGHHQDSIRHLLFDLLQPHPPSPPAPDWVPALQGQHQGIATVPV